MSGKGSGLTGNAFHHVAIAAHRINVVVKNLESWTVITRRQPLGRNRHAQAVSNALTQRPRCGLHTRGEAVLRMPWSFAAQLPELFYVVRETAGPL